MRSHRDILRVIILEDIIQNNFTPHILVCAWFSAQFSPVGILSSKPALKLEAGEVLVDIRFCAAAVTCMCAYAFSQQFFDDRLEWVFVWKSQVGKRQARSVQTSVQRTGVVTLRHSDLFILQQVGPKCVDAQGLCNARSS
jgi:hypothetical protein